MGWILGLSHKSELSWLSRIFLWQPVSSFLMNLFHALQVSLTLSSSGHGIWRKICSRRWGAVENTPKGSIFSMWVDWPIQSSCCSKQPCFTTQQTCYWVGWYWLTANILVNLSTGKNWFKLKLFGSFCLIRSTFDTFNFLHKESSKWKRRVPKHSLIYAMAKKGKLINQLL